MKHLSILLALCMAIFATSCDNDDDKLETTIAFSQCYTVSDPNGDTNLFPEIVTSYVLDLTNGKMSITLNNVQFSPQMPVKITMEITGISLTATSTGYKFSGSNIIPKVGNEDKPEYTITNISGEISALYNANGNACRASFVVNNIYTVNLYSTPMIFERNSSTSVFKNFYDSYMFSYNEAFYVMNLDSEKSTAELYLYNIKFHQMMPNALNLIFKDIPVTITSSGIELNCDEVTAVMNNSEQTPMVDYPITELSGWITNDELILNYKCTITAQSSSVAGSTYSVRSSAYLFPQTDNN